MAWRGTADVGQILDGAGQRKYLNIAERTRFLAAADHLAPPARAFCYVLLYSGCRISEGLDLTAHQMDPEHGTLTFRTLKRRRLSFRRVPVPEPLIVLLTALPTDEDGRFWTMHRATAWQLIKTMMQWAQIVGPMASPKGLRHGFGMHAADCNVPINLIQRWMGHASPTTTAIYLNAVGFEERQFAARMWSITG